MQRDFSISPLLVNHQALPAKNSWVKIFIYEPAEPEVLQSRGTMYAVLSLSAKSSIDFTATMQMILEELHTNYFQQTSGSILQALESTLDGIHKKLILLGQEDKRLGEHFSFDLLTAVSWGTVLYFGQLGNSRAALYRDGKLLDIDEGEQKTVSLYLSSGVLRAGDRVVLGTNQLFKRFTKTSMKKALTLNEDKIVGALEGELDPGPGRVNESAIVLAVDIKQVPSRKGEGLRILDPSNESTLVSQVNSKARSLRRGGLGSIWSGLKGLISRAASWRLAGRLPVLPIVVLALALVVLAISVSGGVSWQAQIGVNQELIAQAKEKVDQADDVAAINPDRAEDLLEEAATYIGQGLASYPSNEQLLALQSRHDELLDQILQVNKLSTDEVTTMNIVPSHPKLVLGGDRVTVIDVQKNELLGVANDGETSIVSSNQLLSRGSLLAWTGQGLAVTSKNRVYLVNESGALGEGVVLPDQVQAVSMAGFIGNGYVLDAAGQVYRVPLGVGASGDFSRYFIRAIGGEELSDLAIDGSVYLLRESGDVEVYLNGEKQALTLERSRLAEGGRALFLTSEKFYILQQDSILSWSKDGRYLGQFKVSTAGEWQAAGIDESGTQLYVLVDGKLLRATLP